VADARLHRSAPPRPQTPPLSTRRSTEASRSADQTPAAALDDRAKGDDPRSSGENAEDRLLGRKRRYVANPATSRQGRREPGGTPSDRYPVFVYAEATTSRISTLSIVTVGGVP
jgi:hypothetical protein